MKRLLIGTMGLFGAVASPAHELSAGAAPANVATNADACVSITDDKARLACFDMAHRVLVVAAPEPKTMPSSTAVDSDEKVNQRFPWLIQIREKGLPKLLAVDEPASIGYVHENQRDAALLKVSIIGTGPAFSDYGWFPFVAADINQNLAATKRTNTKILGGGVRGIIFDYSQTDFALDTTLKVGLKKDSEADTSSTQMLLDNAIVIKQLVVGRPWDPARTTFQLVPAIGLSYEDQRKVEAGARRGKASSAYWGGALTLWPSSLGQRVQINLLAQRFADVNVSSGLKKRFDNYYTFGVDYYLYDPMVTSPLTAIIGLVRELGGNPIDGTVAANRTALVLRLKLN